MSEVSIIRLKRKRGAPQLDALVVDEAFTQSPSKRSRTVAPSAPSASPAKPIFRLVDTVSLDSFTSETQTRALRERITSLLKHPASAARRPSALSTAATQQVSDNPKGEQYAQQTKQARFRVIQQKRSQNSSPSGSTLLERDPRWKEPPVIGRKGDMKIVDIEEDFDDGLPKRRIASRKKALGPLGMAKEKQKQDIRARASLEEDEDDVMKNFVPMLQEYLSMNDTTLSPELSRSNSSAALSDPPSEDEYVYDVYYRSTPATAEPLADDLHLSRVGQLSGLKPADLIYDPTSNDYSSSSEDAEEDEDSNDEQFYKNDYPEQEAEASEDELEAIDQAWVKGDYSDPRRRRVIRSDSEDEDGSGAESSDSGY